MKTIIKEIFDKMKADGWELDNFKQTYKGHLQTLGEIVEDEEREEDELTWACQFICDFLYELEEIDKQYILIDKEKTKKRLTREEYDIVDLLAIRSRIDSWFEIKTDDNGDDYVYDRADKMKLSLKTGIMLLYQGLTDLSDYDLTDKEKKIFKGLLGRLGICEQI